MRDPAESLNHPCDLIAFLDESRKPVRDGRTGRVSGQGDHYVVVAAVVLAADADDCRSLIRAAATDAEATRKPRWKLMSPTRRRMAVARLTELDHWDAIAYETAQPIRNRRVSDAKARSLILRRAFADLHWQRGVRRATLETRSKPSEGFVTHDRRDHQVLESLLSEHEVDSSFRITHAGKEEPLLWLADVPTDTRSDFLCGVDRELWSLMAHRVSAVVQVPMPWTRRGPGTVTAPPIQGVLLMRARSYSPAATGICRSASYVKRMLTWELISPSGRVHSGHATPFVSQARVCSS